MRRTIAFRALCAASTWLALSLGAVAQTGDTRVQVFTETRPVPDSVPDPVPGDSKSFELAGASYLNRGDSANAIKNFDEAIRLDPGNALYYNNRGTAYLDTDPDRAIQDYDQAIKLDPKRPGTYSNRAGAYRRKGDDDRALEDYDRSIELEPTSSALTGRGGLYVGNGDYARAKLDYDEAIRLNPNYASAYTGRAAVYLRSGLAAQAIPDLELSLRLRPDVPATLASLCLAQARVNEGPAALGNCDRGLALQPDNTNLLETRGYAYYRMGQFREASADFSAALRRNAKLPISLYGRGAIKLKSGDATGGDEDIAAAKTLEPDIVQRMENLGISP